MAIPTFDPVKRPLIGEALTTTARTLSAQFGDGYSQVTIDGLNALGRKAVLRWNGLSMAQKDIITEQLEILSGTSFAYQLPIEDVVRIWRCGEWTVNDNDAVKLGIDATFTQVFDLGEIGPPVIDTGGGGGGGGAPTFDSDEDTMDSDEDTMDEE